MNAMPDAADASPRASYVYCVASSRGEPRLARAPRWLPATSRPRALRVAPGLWLVVGDAPLTSYSAARIESGLRDLDWVSRCAMAHEAVVEHVARGGATVLPMKMFTLFADDARALAHVNRLRKRIDALLARVAGRREWGLRVTLDERRALARLAAPASAAPSGTAFLLKKKAEKDAAQRLAAQARAEADRLFDHLAARADDARRRRRSTDIPGRLLLEAAFLVRLEDARAFRAEVARQVRALGPEGYDLALSGPWPPYSFVADAP